MWRRREFISLVCNVKINTHTHTKEDKTVYWKMQINYNNHPTCLLQETCCQHKCWSYTRTTHGRVFVKNKVFEKSYVVSYMGGHRFKPWWVFLFFLFKILLHFHYRQMAGYLKLHCDHLFSHHCILLFTNHANTWYYTIWVIESITK